MQPFRKAKQAKKPGRGHERNGILRACRDLSDEGIETQSRAGSKGASEEGKGTERAYSLV